MNICLISSFLLTRNVYVKALSSIQGIEFVFDFESFEECEYFLSRKKVDAVLVDVKLGDSEFEKIQKLQNKFPDLKFIVLSEQEDIMRVLALGASYVLKDLLLEDFVKIIETILKGNMFVAAFAVDLLTSVFKEKYEVKKQVSTYSLSERETEILSLVTQGKSNTEIGDELALSPFTIKNYISKIIEKLEVKTRAEATAKAFRFGLIAG